MDKPKKRILVDWGILMRRLKKFFIGTIIFFVFFTIVGFFVLPPIVKSILTKKLSENLHRQVTINQVKINPYTLSITARGFLVKNRESSEPFISCDEIFLNFQSLSALRMALILKEIRLKQPYIRIHRNEDASYNFSDLLEKKESKPAEKPTKKPKPLRFSLNNIRIENGSIDFWDGPKQTKHTVRELNIGVPFLSNIPSNINIFTQPVFSAKINETPYRLQGDTKPFADTLETVFDVNVNNLDIPYYLAYLPMKLNFRIVSALLDVQTKVSFIQYKDKGPSLTVTGNVSLKKVALDDDKKNPLFRLPLLDVGIAPTEPLKKIVHLSKISLQSPEVEIKRNQTGSLNIGSLFPDKKETQPAPAPEKKEDQVPLSIDIDEVQLTGGKISFSDSSRNKPFKTILNPIGLKVDHFSNGKDKKTAYALSVTSEVKENIKLEGELSVEPLWAEGGLEIKSVPIKKYSPYYQDQILFNLEEGRLDFSTRYKYTKGDKEPEIYLSGMSVILNSLRLKKPDEKEDFLKIALLSVKDTLVDLTQKKLTIGTFSTEKGNLICNRLKNGDFDLLKLFPPPPPKEEPVKQEKGKEEEKKWIVALGRLSVDQYTVKMGDLSLSQPTMLTGEKITVRGENISTAKNAPGKLSLSLQLDQTGTLSTKNAIVIDPLKIQGSLEVKNIILKKYAPYYQDSILFDIEEGDLDVSTNYQYNKRDKDSEAKLSGLSASLRTLKLKKREEQEGFLNIPILTIQNTGLNLNQKEVSIGDFSTQKGVVLVKRLKDGKLNLQTLFPEPVKREERQEKTEERSTQENAGQAEKPWVVKLGKISVDGYQIKGEDQTTAEPVTIMMDEIQLKTNNLSTAEGQIGNASLALRLNQRGTISTEGAIGINPISANLKMSLKEIEVKPFQPYLTDKVKITVTDGALSTTGNLTLGSSDKKELKATYSGGASLNHFASIDNLNAEDILKMESLAFDDIHFDSNPFSMDVKGIALSNFYARVLIHPDGKLNLQEIFAKEEAKKEAPSKREPPPPEKKGDEPSKEKEPPKNIKIGNITLQGGRMDFSDKSVNPEFSAKLSEIGGRVSGLSSEETSLAEMELRTKLNDYAPLEIIGKINPLKQDLYVDLKVRFKDMDLSPATPYFGKYAGYTIQKGKLSFDLKYLIDKGKLDSQNVIFLDQFTFGDKVESPHATKLPVKLAIALLKDRNGEVKLDIPVTGSLDDPKFSVWEIILKIILNLIAKAATSPFALLGAVFGGGEELSYLEFDDGIATIAETNTKKIDTLVKALSDRPALKLDIEGHVDLERDREGLKQLFFQRKLKTQKLKELVKKGTPAVPVDGVKIEQKEYEKYLKMAYKEEKFPKPRNILGIAKDLPVPEMEKLMLTHIEIKESDLRSLASQRAMSVKDAISKTGKVESERIFILEPKSLAPAKKEKLKDSRVDFTLK
jgi:uncharacterized protein involved in outer membrane biogenesis